VKNVTISIPEEVYRRARIKAAERNTSVSAMVRDFLKETAASESDFDRRKRIQDQVLKTIGDFRAGDRLTRDEVHRRNAVR